MKQKTKKKEFGVSCHLAHVLQLSLKFLGPLVGVSPLDVLVPVLYPNLIVYIQICHMLWDAHSKKATLVKQMNTSIISHSCPLSV